MPVMMFTVYPGQQSIKVFNANVEVRPNCDNKNEKLKISRGFHNKFAVKCSRISTDLNMSLDIDNLLTVTTVTSCTQRRH